MSESMADLAGVDFVKGDSLIPVVVQDAASGSVLMLGYANEQALQLTMATGRLHLFSRSRNQLWLKGEKSGNFLLVQYLGLDCDGDSVLAVVSPATGSTPICHTGAATCFFPEFPSD